MQLAEPLSLAIPGDVMVPADTPQSPQIPPRRRAIHGRPRPLTFHEGFSRREDIDRSPVSEEYLDLFAVSDLDIDMHSSGPTIASIKCDEDISASYASQRPVEAPRTPELRLDTSCAQTLPRASPLALVSDFLGTLAGLVHSPCTPSQVQACRRDEAIMIFDSDVFVDVVTNPIKSTFDNTHIPTPSTWSTPLSAWNFRMSCPDLWQDLSAPSNYRDNLAAVG